MIANMRHNLVLTLYWTIGLVGLAILGFGLFNFIGATIFTIVAAGLTAVTVGAATQGFRFDYALLLIFAWGMVALLGGLLAWLGFATWYRRKKAGPAPDDASMGKSLFGKVVAVAIFGFFAINSGATLYYALGAADRDLQLASAGVTVEAKVLSYEAAPDIHDDAFRVTHSFTLPDGQVMTGTSNQWRWGVDAIKKTGKVQVTYLPKSPEVQRVDFKFDAKDMLEMLGQQFAVMAVGVWGVGLNIGLWRRKKRAADEAEPEPVDLNDRLDTISNLRPNTPGVFGRRGL